MQLEPGAYTPIFNKDTRVNCVPIGIGGKFRDNMSMYDCDQTQIQSPLVKCSNGQYMYETDCIKIT